MMFALFMLIALAITGAVWLLDIAYLRKVRPQGKAESWVVEYSKSFFPVILAVFLIRSYLVEPFKIPSGSMMPTLLVGDFILVNKFVYGLRVPITNEVFFEMDHPKRGDVVVFHFPTEPSTDYIKRLVGLPGDRVTYRNKQLSINGEVVVSERAGTYEYMGQGLNHIRTDLQYETLGEHRHAVLLDPNEPTYRPWQVLHYANFESCSYDEEGFECVVPAGHYFMLGDNRDNSTDSRYWGFVPEKRLVGKAFMIWMNFDNFGRIGDTIK